MDLRNYWNLSRIQNKQGKVLNMKDSLPLVISISRMLGSGGAYIGQALARRLNINYLDREILSQAAKKFSIPEKELEAYEEKTESFWQIMQRSIFGNPYIYTPPTLYLPTGRNLFNVEAEIITRAAKERSAVIVGRCASCILRDRPNHVSVFLHSNVDFRKDRVREIYKLSEKEALNMIAKIDAERARYYNEFAGGEWTDATRYHLAIDTGQMGVDKSIELILNYIELVFDGPPA